MNGWHTIKRLGTTAVRVVGLVLAICIVNVKAAETPKRAPQLVIAQLGNPTALDGWNWTAAASRHPAHTCRNP